MGLRWKARLDITWAREPWGTRVRAGMAREPLLLEGLEVRVVDDGFSEGRHLCKRHIVCSVWPPSSPPGLLSLKESLMFLPAPVTGRTEEIRLKAAAATAFDPAGMGSGSCVVFMAVFAATLGPPSPGVKSGPSLEPELTHLLWA